MSRKFLYTTMGFMFAGGGALLLHAFGIGDWAIAGLFIGVGIAAKGANEAHGMSDVAHAKK